MSTAHVAIIGSGPAGCYTAQFLRKALPDAEITIFERLPVPFGLVRYGVAPDHQGTKAVTRQFDRLFSRERVRFAGNIEIGADLPIEEIEEHYDVVVAATGMDADRRLMVPGADSAPVIGAGQLVRLVNGHPDAAPEVTRIGPRVVLIGHGNVAVDVLRMLLKPLEGYAGSDVDSAVLEALRGDGPISIEVVGRSPVAAAKFDPVVLKELRGLPGVRFEIDEADLSATAPLAPVLRDLVDQSPDGATTRVRLRFGWTPTSISQDATTIVSFRDIENLEHTLEADSVITAIGFEHGSRRLYSGHAHDPALIEFAPRCYRTGWYRRGPHGTIPENRLDAREVAEAIARDITDGTIATGRDGWDGLPEAVHRRAVDYNGWRAIDQFETAGAAPDRIRTKVTDRNALIHLAQNPLTSPQEKP